MADATTAPPSMISAAGVPSERIAPRRLFAFLIMVFGMFMSILDIQIVSASLSDIQAGLSASSSEVSWVQTSYLIAEVIAIPLSGFLSRALGTRLLFAISASGFTIASFLPINSGDYSVAVTDALGAVNSEAARVRSLLLSDLPFTDNLSGSNVISGLAGSGRGSNVGATREPGEPDHANERGTHSVWLSWQPPPPAGVATIDTAGSSFDTLLAVYTGDSFSKLTPVASNDDVNNCDDPTDGFHTSRVRFNAQPGKVYHIAVEGLADASGDDPQRARLKQRAGVDPVAGALRHRQRFPGDRRFVDGARALGDLAIHGDLVVRVDGDDGLASFRG